MTKHNLKVWPEYFEPLYWGEKTFEIRLNDRNYHPWDLLILDEWEPATQIFTGRTVTMEVTYLLEGPILGLREGWVIMSLHRP